MAFDETFLWFVALGAIAQLVDGALGMAYGLVCSTVLLSLGFPPATVSAAVHTAEVVTTGISGGAHAVFGNVDRRLFLQLALPGAVGGVGGALFLVHVASAWIKPLIVLYLLALSVLILLRAARRWHYHASPRQVPPLGLVAGTLDAIGGGGVRRHSGHRRDLCRHDRPAARTDRAGPTDRRRRGRAVRGLRRQPPARTRPAVAGRRAGDGACARASREVAGGLSSPPTGINRTARAGPRRAPRRA